MILHSIINFYTLRSQSSEVNDKPQHTVYHEKFTVIKILRFALDEKFMDFNFTEAQFPNQCLGNI